MELKEALDESIKLWDWLAKTGKSKGQYPWKGEEPYNQCYLCQYTVKKRKCKGLMDCPKFCPLAEGGEGYQCEMVGEEYFFFALSIKPHSRKYWAGKLRDRLIRYRDEYFPESVSLALGSSPSKNGDRKDNKLENLELLPTRKYHLPDNKTKAYIQRLENELEKLKANCQLP